MVTKEEREEQVRNLQKGAYAQWKRIEREYKKGEIKGVVIVAKIEGEKIVHLIWPKSAYLRHIDRCMRKNLPLPEVLCEAGTGEEALEQYTQLFGKPLYDMQ